MKQTRRQALHDCRKHWQDIYDNWDKYLKECNSINEIKELSFEAIFPQRDSIDADCFACEYDTTHEKGYCYSKCIVNWKTKSGYCTHSGSPFYELYENHDLNIKHVKGVLACINRSIAKLPPLKRKMK